MPFGYDWLEFAQIISAVAAPVLTLILAWLYFRMVRIQGRQTEILGRQEALMEANHRPVLEVNEISHAGDDNIRLTVGNRGNGIAKDLKLGVEVYSNSNGMEERSSSLPVGEGEIIFAERPLINVNTDGELGDKVAILEPGVEKELISSLRITLHERNKGALTLPAKERYSVQEYVRKLEDEGVDRVYHYFYLYYSDISDQNQQTLVETGSIEPKSGMDLGDILSASGVRLVPVPSGLFKSRYQRIKNRFSQIIHSSTSFIRDFFP